MATQSGLLLTAPDEPYKIVSSIPIPRPGPKQVLVKSLVTGINPVEPMMFHTGSNILSPFPAVIGCEGSGAVAAIGPNATRFKEGDGIFGCTRLGVSECATFQEHFLMDEDLAYRRPGNLSAEEASTLGVALDTAALGLVGGLGITLPEPGTKTEEKDEWIIILGGSGSVGAVAVQVARLAGYKVLASSSPAKAAVALSNGATATFDHSLDIPGQVAEIKKVTGGNFNRVFDASARAHDTAAAALEQMSSAKEGKICCTVNTWTPFPDTPGIELYRVKLGEMGQDTDLGREVTAKIASYIPSLEKHVANGAIKPLPYQLVEGKGWEAIIKAQEVFEKGVERKVAVRVQDERVTSW
ncbi:chaperonin 10-like protein [Coniochaeta sp. 2T2.1]|nr:chaperonin 10-like protein [Coniochaeta sp. 2T2.1]